MTSLQVYLYEQQLAPSTIAEIQRSVKQFTAYLKDEHIPLKQCAYTDIMAYVSHLQTSGRKTSYINQVLNHLRHYFKYLVHTKQAKQNPASGLYIQGVLRHKLVSSLKEEELRTIYMDFRQKVPYKNPQLKQRDTLLLGLIIFQALQINELQHLLTTDIELEQGLIHVPGTSRTNSRVLNLQASQMATITDYLKDKPSEKLFELHVGRQLSRICDTMAIQVHINVNHQLIRQSRIILWLKQHHIRQVQYLAGMRYISSLKTYQEQLMDGLRDKVDQFHPLG